MNLIGRDKELAILRGHARAGKNLVVVGPEGVGKTALVREALDDALHCADTSTLKAACESLLAQLSLDVPKCDNVLRKRAILQATAGRKRCFVFDRVGWVSPKLLSFLENVHEAHPMVIVTRSLAWSDIGHLKMILWDFDKLELAPLAPAAIRQVLRAQMQTLQLRVPDAEQFEADVLRIAGHNLHVLGELCQQTARGRYVFGKRLSTQLLDLDRRIASLRKP
jgi:hypothetical protein